MAWRIELSQTAKKQLAKLDRSIAKRLWDFLREPLAMADDPRSLGSALKGSEPGEFRKYRVGDFRIIARMGDNKLTILIVRTGNRREEYR